MPDLTLTRQKESETLTIGRLTGLGVDLVTLELPWYDNQVNASRIPPGRYVGRMRTHTSRVLQIDDVPGREGILIHVGNYPSDTHGCILVGLEEGYGMIRKSRAAMDLLLQALERANLKLGYFTLQIDECFPTKAGPA